MERNEVEIVAYVECDGLMELIAKINDRERRRPLFVLRKSTTRQHSARSEEERGALHCLYFVGV
jgi:hypothetical protein